VWFLLGCAQVFISFPSQAPSLLPHWKSVPARCLVLRCSVPARRSVFDVPQRSRDPDLFCLLVHSVPDRFSLASLFADFIAHVLVPARLVPGLGFLSRPGGARLNPLLLLVISLRSVLRAFADFSPAPAPEERAPVFSAGCVQFYRPEFSDRARLSTVASARSTFLFGCLRCPPLQFSLRSLQPRASTPVVVFVDLV
jgi:hypothetical protein